MSDRYQITEQIGRGGVGVVYRAFDTHLDREVAIKRVLVDSGQSIDELTENLIAEAKVLSTLNHPNIVTIHDVGVDDEGPFVVMEMLNGQTVDEIIKNGVMSVEDFEQFADQVLEGLNAAQSVNVLHRDLKPPNIMIVWLPGPKFQFKILDFGLAKFSRKPSTQTVSQGDSIFGSIFFMAPEQFEQLPLDGRTDLYSVGAIFYYALTGQHPFQGEMAAQVMAAHMQNRFVPLKTLRPDVPEYLCRWVENLMARDMADRPANAQVALEALRPVKLIDEKQLREVASHDASVASQLLSQFENEVGELLQQIKRELASGEGVQAAETAQNIRGTAATLGYLEVIELAKAIEDYAPSDSEHSRATIIKIEAAINRLKDAHARLDWAT